MFDLSLECRVALLAEGVDRNGTPTWITASVSLSPSSRRAWIEIIEKGFNETMNVSSPSSRRAWIEIGSVLPVAAARVSPSSRRAWIEMVGSHDHLAGLGSRPPRGGRG